jgi:hypothetical protein
MEPNKTESLPFLSPKIPQKILQEEALPSDSSRIKVPSASGLSPKAFKLGILTIPNKRRS